MQHARFYRYNVPSAGEVIPWTKRFLSQVNAVMNANWHHIQQTSPSVWSCADYSRPFRGKICSDLFFSRVFADFCYLGLFLRLISLKKWLSNV